MGVALSELNKAKAESTRKHQVNYSVGHEYRNFLSLEASKASLSWVS